MANIKVIAEELVRLTIEEVANLAEVLKNEYDVTAAECVEKGKEGMSFGAAVEAMKLGKHVARKGWNEKGMYLWLKPPANVKAEWCKDPHLKELAEQNGGEIEALGTICMLTADKKILTGWLASQTDILSQDWIITEQGIDPLIITKAEIQDFFPELKESRGEILRMKLLSSFKGIMANADKDELCKDELCKDELCKLVMTI